MRLVSVGYNFDDERVAEIKYDSPRTLLDFDVILWDPALAIPESAWEEDSFSGTTKLFEGRQVVRKNESAGIGRMIHRRTTEMARLLTLGKVLVIFLPDSADFYLHTGETRNDGTAAKPRFTNIVGKQTLFAGLPVGIEITEAEGDRFELKAGAPFASFWRSCGKFFAYRSYLTSQGAPPTLVIPGTDLPLARTEAVGDGTLILLPDFGETAWVEQTADNRDRSSQSQAPDETDGEEEEDYDFAPGFIDALVGLIEELRGTAADGPPTWTERYLLPGEGPSQENVNRAELQLAELLTSIDEQKTTLAVLQRTKSLFAGSGQGLEGEVRACFTRLGCRVEEGQPGRTDLIVHHGERVAVVEVKGVTGSGAEKHSAQLEKWVAEYYEDHEVHAKPILVVNSFRDKPLEERGVTFPGQMLSYAESRGHCLITGLQLLGASLAFADDPDAGASILASLFDCVGVWPDYQDWTDFLDAQSGDQ
jgi:hypothetical protein